MWSAVVADDRLAASWLSTLPCLPDFEDPTDDAFDGPSGVCSTARAAGVAAPEAVGVGRGLSAIVATLPSSAYIEVPPSLLLWNALTAGRLRTSLTTSGSSNEMWLSSADEPASKKCMTPFPDLMARAWAVRAISCASCSVSDCKKVKPQFRMAVMVE